MPAKLNLKGVRFGRLLATEEDNSKNQTAWFCKCDCGDITSVLTNSLISGRTQSCGCKRKEVFTNMVTSHGLRFTREYRIWCNMKSRCLNPNFHKYPIYGGRGISICKRWINSFENFFADMGKATTDTHSIDRIDVDGNYEPSNCRWATPKEQANNKRKVV